MVELTEINADPSLLAELHSLLLEYGKYMYEELSLIAGKESFLKDLEHFPGVAYQPPQGNFIVATFKNKIAGCVGIKRFTNYSCEMKRMYIRAEFRKKGIGKLLTDYVINWSKKFGYGKILLDTNEEMKDAVMLYQSCGFKQIAPYCVNENEHPIFMEYLL